MNSCNKLTETSCNWAYGSVRRRSSSRLHKSEMLNFSVDACMIRLKFWLLMGIALVKAFYGTSSVGFRPDLCNDKHILGNSSSSIMCSIAQKLKLSSFLMLHFRILWDIFGLNEILLDAFNGRFFFDVAWRE